MVFKPLLVLFQSIFLYKGIFLKFDSLTKYRWTFGDIMNATKILSAALQVDYGLQKGEIVALALPNCVEFVVSFLAISRCGGVTTLINPSCGTSKKKKQKLFKNLYFLNK